MTHQTETAELIQAAAKLDPSAWLSAEGTPVRLHPDAAAALGGLLVAIAHTDDETLNKASLVRSAALTAARVVAASSLDAACAHCGSSDHTWDDCEAYTRLTADAYARTLNTPPSAETCAAIRDRLHSGSEPAAVSAAVAPPTNQTTAEAALDAARATNQRLNREKQRLESELATYRAAVAQWEISDHSAYVPLRSLAAIARAAGVDVPERWELHYERVERAEAALRRMADETTTETPAPDDRRLHACIEFGTWFDRSVCAEPCGAMHTRCTECGVALDTCPQQPAAGARQDGAES